MTAGTLTSLPLSKIQIHTANTRRPQTSDGIKELAQSIREQGVLEPIIAIQRNGTFLAVAGSRRVAAAKIAGLSEIPAILRDMTDEEAAAAALVENLQRKDLDPLEEAEGYKAWLALTGKTQAELAAALGRDPSTIANALRLLRAPAPVRDALRSSTVGAAHARELLRLEDESLLGKVKLAKGTTVRDVQDQVDAANRDWRNAGAPAIAAAKAFLADARAKYPKATITWQKERQEAVVDLVEALGPAPARIAGEITHAKIHDKVCACRAYEVDSIAEYDPGSWDDERLELKGFELRRTCIDRDGNTKYRNAQLSADRASWGGSSAAKPKKKSAADIARARAKEQREFRETVGKILAGSGRYSGPCYAPAATEKLLTGGGYTADKTVRVVYLSYILERVGGSAELLEVVRRALAMRPNDIRAIVLRLAAREVNDRLLGHGTTTDPYKGQVARYEFLKAYGQKVAEPKPKDRSAKKASR